LGLGHILYNIMALYVSECTPAREKGEKLMLC
jgi:hypothetical protein